MKIEKIEKLITMAPELSLPMDAVTQSIAFMGRKGSGKTFGAGRMVEGMLALGAQVVIVDPVGTWWGLRLNRDGKTPGWPIPIFGGLHGDIPLEGTAGALMAKVVTERGISAVLDVSQMTSADAQRFVTAFGKELFQRQKANPKAVMIVLEEAQEVAPQQPQKGELLMLHEWQRIVKLGRNFGIGVTLISQRPQEVAKKVLNMTELVFAFQMTGVHERRAMKEWIAEKGEDTDVIAALPKLEVGTAMVWSPQWLKVSDTFEIMRKETYDASSTPVVGEGAQGQVQTLSLANLKELEEEMAQTIERGRESDPAHLKGRIQKLERDLDQAEKRHAVTLDRQVVQVEDPKKLLAAYNKGYELADRKWRERSVKLVDALAARSGRLAVDAQELGADIEKLGQALAISPGFDEAPVEIAMTEETRTRLGPGDQLPRVEIYEMDDDTETPFDGAQISRGDRGDEELLDPDQRNDLNDLHEAMSNEELLGRLRRDGKFVPFNPDAPPGPAQKIIDILGYFRALGANYLTPGLLAAMAGYHEQTKSYRNALSWLNARGLLEKQDGRIGLAAHAKSMVKSMPRVRTLAELHEAVCSRLGGPARKILTELVERRLHGQGPMAKDQLAALMGYNEQTKSYRNALSQLHSLGFVDYPTRGLAAASDLLFPDAMGGT